MSLIRWVRGMTWRDFFPRRKSANLAWSLGSLIGASAVWPEHKSRFGLLAAAIVAALLKWHRARYVRWVKRGMQKKRATDW